MCQLPNLIVPVVITRPDAFVRPARSGPLPATGRGPGRIQPERSDAQGLVKDRQMNNGAVVNEGVAGASVARKAHILAKSGAWR